MNADRLVRHLKRFILVFSPSSERDSSNDARNGKTLSPDKQTMLSEVKKCMMPDFAQCMVPTQISAIHAPVPVKLEVEENGMMGAPVSANEYSHGLQDNHMLTTLTNTLVGL